MLFTIKIFVLELMSLNVSNKDSIDRSERLDTNETREKNTTPVATSRFTEKQWESSDIKPRISREARVSRISG